MQKLLKALLAIFVFGIAARDCNAQIWPIGTPLPYVKCAPLPPLLNQQVTFWYQGLNAADTLTVEYREINKMTFQPIGNWLSVPMTATNYPPPYFFVYQAHYADIPGGVPAGKLWQWQIKRGAVVIFGPTFFFS